MRRRISTVDLDCGAWTIESIAALVEDYAIYHEVETDAVDVSLCRDNAGRVVGGRLSLDVDGRSHGGDEVFGFWE